MLFLILAWRYGFFLSEIFFLSSSTRSTGFGSVCHEPCPTTNFSYYLFPLTGRSPHFRFGVPANHLVSLFFLPVSGDPMEVTEYKHLFLTVILWWLATVNSNRRIIVIIFLSSQWDTTWQTFNKLLNRSIWPIDGTLTGTTTQSGPGSNDNEEDFCIPQSSSSGASPLDSCHIQEAHWGMRVLALW